MPGEQGDKNEQISDSAKLDQIANIMGDALARMDSVASRLDALEARDSARKDADEGEDKAKEDGEDEIVEKGDPEEPIVDKGRKDSEEEKGDKPAFLDKGRKDSAEEEEEKMADKSRKDAVENALDSALGQIASLQAQIENLSGRVPAILDNDSRERFAQIQEQAEPAFQAFGDKAPAPLDGETPTNYKRRLATRMQKHSPKWSGHRLSATSDDAMLDTIAADIYADSIVAARRGVAVEPGQLREIVTRSQAGHTRIEFEGDASAWMDSLAGASQRAMGKFLTH